MTYVFLNTLLRLSRRVEDISIPDKVGYTIHDYIARQFEDVNKIKCDHQFMDIISSNECICIIDISMLMDSISINICTYYDKHNIITSMFNNNFSGMNQYQDNKLNKLLMSLYE